jgi:hypothetical protein
VSPTICEPSGTVDAWAPTAGWTACGWACGIVLTGPGVGVEAVEAVDGWELEPHAPSTSATTTAYAGRLRLTTLRQGRGEAAGAR